MGSLSKDETFNRIAKEWNFVNIRDLEGIKDDIIITTPKEWYYPDDDFNICRILQKWAYAFSNASKRGKRGLRSFVDVTAFYCVQIGECR